MLKYKIMYEQLGGKIGSSFYDGVPRPNYYTNFDYDFELTEDF
jgi:hypothetical protein